VALEVRPLQILCRLSYVICLSLVPICEVSDICKDSNSPGQTSSSCNSDEVEGEAEKDDDDGYYQWSTLLGAGCC
jgi:hypothetical protein